VPPFGAVIASMPVRT